MNTATTNNSTRRKGKHRFKLCQRCKNKKQISSFDHDTELKSDKRLCTPCYNYTVKRRQVYALWRETKEQWVASRILEGKEEPKFGCDSDVGAGRFYLLNGAYIKSGVKNFVLVIESRQPIRHNFLMDIVRAADLLDFDLHTMGTDEYVALRDDVPSVVLNTFAGAEMGVLEAIYTVKKSQNHFFKGNLS
jgi:hypothetical protein